MLDQRGRTLFDALQAFFQEHQYCGDLDGGVEDDRVWMTCTCGAVMLRLSDRLTDETGEYEIIGRPYTTNAGKDVHVRVGRVDNAERSYPEASAEREAPISKSRICPWRIPTESASGPTPGFKGRKI